ncbi:uncharacterized protein C12orf73 homolog isoform X1 [Enhydra lutris kenyoni]|uniref:Uncharacterized protein C12orf73 homolog isoform X1 n=2 Tax=Enhydra lutris kenyoni TaxID=391180 RepID=A0A2Y9IUN1_ENHLU|nr:uncharacterized protein C12orf73 homolog isoform X1 [Enhydra lutris kenyoni]
MKAGITCPSGRRHSPGFPARRGPQALYFRFRPQVVCCDPGRTSARPLTRCPTPVRSAHPLSMPAGVSWATYLKMFAASLLTMCAGAEVVHRYYRPDLTIPEIPPKPGELKTELLGLKKRQHEPQISQQ